MSAPAVVLTGPEGEEGALGSGLRALGVEVHHLPLLEVAPPADGTPLREAVRAFARYDAVVFASPRAVAALRAALDGAGVPDGGRKAMTVGPATSRRARDAGFPVVVEGDGEAGQGAEGLLAALDRARHAVTGQRLLLPASERARPALADGLAARGALVDVVPAYTVRPAPLPADRLAGLFREFRGRDGGPPPLLLASPSAAEVLAGSGDGGFPRPPRLIAIGGTTARAMVSLGLEPAAVAARPTPEGIAEALRSLEEVRS